MPTIETSIWLALRGRVASLVFSPALPVAWPNEDFTPPQVGTPPKPGPFLEVTHFPNKVERLLINDGPHRRPGILQIAVMTALNENAAVAIEIAGTVAAHFPADLKVAHGDVTARVTKAPDVGRAIRDTERGRWLTPVSIYYEVYA